MSPGQARYTAERRAFDWLRDTCPEAARRDYEQAIRTLVERYNTTIYENRFVVGGAVEVFTWALLRSAGIAAVFTPRNFEVTAIMCEIARIAAAPGRGDAPAGRPQAAPPARGA